MSLTLQSDEKNSASPVMGDRLRFWSTVTNTGATPIEGLVAWISLVEMDAGNEQPVDLEDWSAQKAVAGASLTPGESLRTDWPMRLIKSGDYRVVVSVTDRGSRRVFTSPTVQFHVREKAVLDTRRVILVAASMPLLVLLWLGITQTSRRRRNLGRSHPIGRSGDR